MKPIDINGLTQTEIETLLELIVDRYNIVQVIDMLADVCSTKAHHIEENWNDNSLAMIWYKHASNFAMLAHRIVNGEK